MGSHIIRNPPQAPPPREGRIVLDAIRRIFRILRESSRAAEQGVGVSGAQLFVLQRLAGHSTLSINELAALTLTHQSSVSVVVSRLEKAGLIRRTRAPDDARRTEIALTRAGRSLLKRAPTAAQDRLIEGLSRLAPTDQRALARGLDRLVDAMGLRDRAPAMFFEDAPTRKGKGKGRADV